MESTVTEKIVLAHEPPFALGPLEVRPAVRTVVRGEREEVLEPRVMQVLVVLARANGHVVSRDDLAHCCWDGRVVGDDAINRVLSRLRRLADGIGHDAFAIETITRVGYRLVRHEPPAPIPPASAPLDRADPAAPMRRGLDRRTLVAGGVGAATLAAGGAVWLLKRPALSPAAQQAIERGIEAFRQGTPDQLATAIAAFHDAVEAAPDSARSWGALALAYMAQYRYAVKTQQVAVLAARAREAAARALAIDPDNVDAQAALIGLTPVYGHWLQADARIRSLLERHPTDPSANHAALELFAQTGQERQFQQCVRRVLAAEPGWPKVSTAFVQCCWILGQLEQADAAMAQAFARWPRHYSVWFTRQRLLCFTGRPAEALAMIADVDARPIGIPDWNFDMCRTECQAVLTRAPADIAAAVKGYVDEARRGMGFAENAVQFFSYFGMIDDALRMLEAIYFQRGTRIGEQRYSAEQGQYVRPTDGDTWFLWFPMCAALRADRRLLPILRDIGLVDFWKTTGTRPDFPIAGL